MSQFMHHRVHLRAVDDDLAEGASPDRVERIIKGFDRPFYANEITISERMIDLQANLVHPWRVVSDATN